MLARAERRSITGRWKTIACSRGRVRSPPHEISPELGLEHIRGSNAQQHALSRAIGAEHDRAAPGFDSRSSRRRAPVTLPA
jgi:hypothetical protein